MQAKYKELSKKALQGGASNVSCINTSSIVFDPRALLKCRFGCKRWGKYWTCPPNLSLSQEEFQAALDCYQTAMLLQASDPLLSQNISLEIEKEAMLVWHCHYAFAMALCVQCDECAYPEPCLYPHLARPAMDAFGIDIEKTVKAAGFELQFDSNGKLLPSWFSLVLIQ